MRIIRATVSKNGQVINLPEEYGFKSAGQVTVRKVGKEIVLSPTITSWEPLLKFIESLPDDLEFAKNKPDLSDNGNLF